MRHTLSVAGLVLQSSITPLGLKKVKNVASDLKAELSGFCKPCGRMELGGCRGWLNKGQDKEIYIMYERLFLTPVISS